jgi:NTP pyrophosphatase (non-canonical NTP hydrolase)
MAGRMTVDQKSWELAEHFLADYVGVTKEETQELAEAIQSAVEDHLSNFRADKPLGPGRPVPSHGSGP